MAESLSSMAEEEIFDSLGQWLETFALEEPVTAENLSSGLHLALVLNLVDPGYFNEVWTSKLTQASEASSSKIKLSNLKRILKGIMDYYEQQLGQNVSQNFIPDVNQIAESSSKSQLNLLLQLILGIVVNCPQKEEYIGRIMKLEESVQHMVMCAIQDLQSGASTSGEGRAEDFQLSSARDDLKRIRAQNEELNLKCFDLDSQNALLAEEVAAVSSENERLLARLTESENLDDPNSAAGRQILLLRQKVDDLQSELYRMESGKDEQKVRSDNFEKENKELLKRIEELVAFEEENRILKDEVDELRSRASDASKFESTVEGFKKRLEEMSDLKIQLKILEEKNSAYMKCAIDCEEEVRKNGVLKTQLDAYKAQLQEAQSRLADETKRGDKWEFEASRLKEKADAVQREKERLAVELETVREIKDELVYSQLSTASTPGDVSGDEGAISASECMVSAPELREKLLRLEHENQMLKVSKKSELDQESQLLTTQLEDASARIQALESENRLQNKRVMELEHQLSDRLQAQDAHSTGTDSRLMEKHRELERQALTLAHTKEQMTQLDQQLREKDEKWRSAESQLEKANAQIAKFKINFEKARTVIEVLEQAKTLNAAETGIYSRADFDSLKRELAEKERIIQRLQEEQERTRIMKEQEERLITTAFHSMAMQTHRRSSEDRMQTAASATWVSGVPSQQPGGPSSFLERQRQIVTAPRTAGPGSFNSHQSAGSSIVIPMTIFWILVVVVAFRLLSILLTGRFGGEILLIEDSLDWLTGHVTQTLIRHGSLRYVNGPPPS